MTYGRTYDFTRYADYVAYFEALAADHPAFFNGPSRKTFFQWHLEDLDKSLNDLKLAFPALLIEEPESQFSDNGAMYITDRIMGAVVVVDHLKPGVGPAEEVALKTRCKELAMGVLAKMYHDKYQLRITGFNPANSKGAFIGPAWDNVYGFRLEFELVENSTDAQHDVNDYTESIVDSINEYARNNAFAHTGLQGIYNTIFNMRRNTL